MGANEVPVNASTATGFGTVVLNGAATQATVNLTFSGLTANAIAAHIHGPAAVGVNNAVIYPITGVPAATAGTVPTQVFSTITPAQVTDLRGGLHYLNVHTANWPGGEIRGQLAAETATARTSANAGGTSVPALGTSGLALLGLILAAAAFAMLRRIA